MSLINLRFRKILRDTWGYKARTGLVILTIAIGVFAVGTLGRVWYILSQNISNNYLEANPASATVATARTFDADLVTAVERLPGIANAEGVNERWGRVEIGTDQWRTLLLSTRADYVNGEIGTLVSEDGAWPPVDGELWMERSSLALLPYEVGDTVLIEMPGGGQHRLVIAGSVYDVVQISTAFSLTNYGYVTPGTFREVTGGQDFSQLRVTVAEDAFNVEHIEDMLDDVTDAVEANNNLVIQKEIPAPGKHELDTIVQSVLLLLGALSALGLLLSIFLVVNIVSALLTQQTEQIGTIKAVGGVSSQLLVMYLGAVVLFGVIALLISVPVATLLARWISGLVAGLINFDINSFSVPPRNLLMEIGIGAVLPTLAALYPVIRASRLTVRESIGFSSSGQGSEEGNSPFEVILRVLPTLPVTVLYPFRNVFRRKARLILATITLSMAGAILIAVFSVRASFIVTVDDIAEYWQQDISIVLSELQTFRRVNQILADVPGVVRVEPRLSYSGFRVYPDATESTRALELFGLDPTSPFLAPDVVRGRWLTAEDTNAVVINLDLLSVEPDLGVGDELVVTIRGDEVRLQVVGVVTSQVVGARDPLLSSIGYVNYTYFARQLRQPGEANRVLVGTDTADAFTRAELIRTMQRTLSERGIFTISMLQEQDYRRALGDAFAILLTLLQIASVVFGLVGGLGLMSMMTLNVLERTREIGIIRSVGGVRSQLGQIIVIEGVFVGVLSWFFAVILAYPLSIVLGNVLGRALLRTPLIHVFPLWGPLLWLVLVIILAVVSSVVPGRNAASLSIRETLSFE